MPPVASADSIRILRRRWLQRSSVLPASLGEGALELSTSAAPTNSSELRRRGRGPIV